MRKFYLARTLLHTFIRKQEKRRRFLLTPTGTKSIWIAGPMLHPMANAAYPYAIALYWSSPGFEAVARNERWTETTPESGTIPKLAEKVIKIFRSYPESGQIWWISVTYGGLWVIYSYCQLFMHALARFLSSPLVFTLSLAIFNQWLAAEREWRNDEHIQTLYIYCLFIFVLLFLFYKLMT